MKVFADKKAMRLFGDLYQTLPENQQKVMGEKVRSLARIKMESDSEEFYVTTDNVRDIYRSLTATIAPTAR